MHPRRESPARRAPERSNVLYWSAGGLSAAGNQIWTQKGRGVAGIPEIDDHFGQALVSANLGYDRNDTALDDLAISVDESVHGVHRAGQVHVLFGRENGLSTKNSQILITSTSGLVGSRRMNGEFGAGLATGEFGSPTSGPRYSDLVARMFVDDETMASSAGIQIVYGGPRGPGSLGAQLWTPQLAGKREPTRWVYELGGQDSDRSY